MQLQRAHGETTGRERKMANVERCMQRRADLVPNLVKAAQMPGLGTGSFGQIAEARSRLLMLNKQPRPEPMATRRPSRSGGHRCEYSFGVRSEAIEPAESYPQLRSVDAFMNVQTELAGTENRIKVSRDDYNAAVTDTTRLEISPCSFDGVLFGLRKSLSSS